MKTPLRSRMLRTVAGAAAASALLVASAAGLAAAGASIPPGSAAQVILETHSVTGQPYYASLKGWWGHENGTTEASFGTTYLSLDASNGQGVVSNATIAALHKKLGDGGRFDSLRVAFVPYSADGHNERPHVTKGENAGQAFAWFSDLGFGSPLNGKKGVNDFVTWVSTLQEYTKWWNAGRPVQSFTSSLKVLDVDASGATHPSSVPEGASILNRWPAGTKISLVLYVSDGVDKAMPLIPKVKVGPDGRAMSSWLTFETVKSPTNPARTSGGYRVLTGAGTGPQQAHKPVSTATGQSGTGANGTNGTPTAAPQANGSTSQAADKSSGGVMSKLPGGKPTSYTLLALIVLGVGAWVTRSMRSRGA